MLGFIFKHPILTIVSVFVVNVAIIGALVALAPKNGFGSSDGQGNHGSSFRPTRHNYSTSIDDLKKELKKAETNKADALRVVQLLDQLGDYCVTEDQPKEAQRYYERAIRARAQNKLPEDEDFALTLMALSDVLNTASEEKESTLDKAALQKQITLLQRAKQILVKVHKSDDLSIYNVLSKLAVVYGNAEKPEEQEECLKQALTIAEKNHVAEDGLLTEALSSLCSLYDQQERYKESEQLYRRLLQINQRELGVENGGVVSSHVEIAENLIKQERPKEAEEEFKKALKIVDSNAQVEEYTVRDALCGYLNLVGGDKNRTAESEALAGRFALLVQRKFPKEVYRRMLKDMGENALLLNHADAARIFYKRSVEETKKDSNKDSFSFAEALVGLGDTYQQQKKYKEAQPYYESALQAVGDQISAPDELSEVVLDGLFKSLSDNLHFMHEYTRAAEFYKKRIALIRSDNEPDNGKLANAYYDLGINEFAAGNFKLAVEAYRDAVAFAEKDNSQDKTELASNLWALARAEGRCGEFKAQERELKKVCAIFREAEDESELEALADLVNCLRAQKRNQEVEQIRSRISAEYKKEVADPENTEYISGLKESYGEFFSAAGFYKDAEPLLQASLNEHLKEVASKDEARNDADSQAHLNEIKAELAHALAGTGKYIAAEKLYSETAPNAENAEYFTTEEGYRLLSGYATVLRQLKKDELAATMNKRAALLQKGKS